VLDVEWGEERSHPIFEAAAEHGLAIAMHVAGGTRCAVPLPSHYMSWHAGFSQNYMAQVIGLVVGGVFEKFPTLKVLMLEGGWTWLPHVLWRMDRDWNAVRREVPWLKKPPSEYILEHVYFGTQPLEEPKDPSHLATMMDLCGSDEIFVFASDYPHWDFDDPVRAIPRGIGGERRERIMGRNALALYGDRLGLVPARSG
jgi:predicted TIM-barrel fold metal-dependent hydrolase